MSFDPPSWLRHFGADELRPFLVPNTTEGLAAVQRWEEHRASQIQRRTEWETRRNEHIRALLDSSSSRPAPRRRRATRNEQARAVVEQPRIPGAESSPGDGWHMCEWWQ